MYHITNVLQDVPFPPIRIIFINKKLQISQTTKNSRKVLSKYPVCNQGCQNAKVDLMGKKMEELHDLSK